MNDNAKHVNYDYAIRDEMMIIDGGVSNKTRNEHDGPFPIIKY